MCKSGYWLKSFYALLCRNLVGKFVILLFTKTFYLIKFYVIEPKNVFFIVKLFSGLYFADHWNTEHKGNVFRIKYLSHYLKPF